MADNFDIKLKEYQDEFIYNDNYKFKFLKSAWGTGKTTALIIAGIRESEVFENNLGVIFRKEYEDLRDSTCKDFETYTGLKIPSSREIVIGKNSMIMFRHIEELNNIQNMNLGWFGIEQGDELDTDDQFIKLCGRLRRADTGRRGFVIANAKGHNWIYKLKNNGMYLSDDKTKRIDLHLAATTWDNADNLPKDYLQTLKILETTKPETYRRFVENSDDEGDCIDIIIKQSWVEEAVGREVEDATKDNRICVVCDPARYGDDNTVNSVFKGNKRIFLESYGQKDTMFTAGRLINLRTEYNAGNIAIDVVGLGGGIADRIKELGQNVFEINSASKFENNELDTKIREELKGKYIELKDKNDKEIKDFLKKRYKNVRAQMWTEAREKFKNGKPSFSGDEKTKEQLCNVRYKTIESNGCLQVESKEDIKKPERLGCSPDFADNFVMGLFAIDYADFEAKQERVVVVEPEYQNRDRWRKRRN